MKNPNLCAPLALSLALMLACGSALAQLKPPAKSQSKGELGSGLGTKAAPPSPAAGKQPSSEAKGTTYEDIVQEIANCMLSKLPEGWQVAQLEVNERSRDGKQREFEASYSYADSKGMGTAFTPCDLREPALNLYKLNAALDPDKRNWTRATLLFSKEGKFELQYDYGKQEGDAGAAPPAAQPAAPAAAPPAKPDPNYDPTKK